MLVPAATQANEPIIVESRNTAQDAWVSRLADDLDARLTYPRFIGYRVTPTGAVSVRFECGLEGRPAGIVVTRESGNRTLDRAAAQAVAKLSGLHPLPAGFATGQLVRADIVFAASPDEAAGLARRLQRDNDRLVQLRKPGEPRELAVRVVVASPG